METFNTRNILVYPERWSGNVKKRKNESSQNFYKRISHAYLQNRNIDNLDNILDLCASLRVLYLYENSLTRNPTLFYNSKLTHLYLQSNIIENIDTFAPLPQLEKLYLSKNKIRVITGLQNLENLKELYVDSQQIGDESVQFEENCMSTLTNLVKLDTSFNNMTDLTNLTVLKNLQILVATNNNISDYKKITQAMDKGWKKLKNLDISENPVQSNSKALNLIISYSSDIMENINGRKITSALRSYSKSRSHDFTVYPFRLPQLKQDRRSQ